MNQETNPYNNPDPDNSASQSPISDQETPLSKRDRKALKKQERQTLQAYERRMRKMRQYGKLAAILLVIAALIGGVVFYLANQRPQGEDFSQEMPIEGREHLPEGTPLEYQSNPPSSGPHWPIALSDGVYREEKPDEAIIHSLEHGRVWISYLPEIPEEVIEQLEEIGRSENPVIVTPRSANDTDIALSAWGRLDTFNLENGTFDEQRILDFIRRYRHQGPEYIPGMGPGHTYDNWSYNED